MSGWKEKENQPRHLHWCTRGVHYVTSSQARWVGIVFYILQVRLLRLSNLANMFILMLMLYYKACKYEVWDPNSLCEFRASFHNHLSFGICVTVFAKAMSNGETLSCYFCYRFQIISVSPIVACRWF